MKDFIIIIIIEFSYYYININYIFPLEEKNGPPFFHEAETEVHKQLFTFLKVHCSIVSDKFGLFWRAAQGGQGRYSSIENYIRFPWQRDGGNCDVKLWIA